MIFIKTLKNTIQKKQRKLLIAFVDTIADVFSNKKLNPIVTTKSYFAAPKKIRLNSMHCFFMKIPNKRELQKIAFNHSPVIDFMNL